MEKNGNLYSSHVPAPLRFLHVSTIALVGGVLAVITIGVSLWMTERPTSLASSLPTSATLLFLRTNDRTLLMDWIKKIPHIEKPLPMFDDGTRYEFALLETKASPAWALMIYRGKMLNAETLTSSETARHLLQTSKEGQGPLSQSHLLRRFVTDEQANILWVDTKKMFALSGNTAPILRSLLLSPSNLLLINPTKESGTMIVDGVRLPYGKQPGMIAPSIVEGGISISLRHPSAFIGTWLSNLGKEQPALAEGMLGVIKGIRETWGLRASMDPILQSIAMMPLSIRVHQKGTGYPLQISLLGSIPMKSDQRTLLHALKERGGRGKMRSTVLDKTTTQRDIIDDTDSDDLPQTEGEWSVYDLGGVPELWMAIRGSSFILSTDPEELTTLKRTIELPEKQSVFLSLILDTETLAQMTEAFLPFMKNEIDTLDRASILSSHLVHLTVEPMHDMTIVRWEEQPQGHEEPRREKKS